MKRLEDLTVWQRLILAIAIVLAVFLLLLGLSRWFGEAAAQKIPELPPLPPKGAFIGKATPWDQKMIDLDREALDLAYKDTIQHLFSVWTRDDEGQPARAIKGAIQARRAYILVSEGLDRREQELKERAKQQ